MTTQHRLNQDTPYVMVFAGPNGSGKTTLIEEVKKTGLAALGDIFATPHYFINPDQFAKDMAGDFATQDERDWAAFNAAVSMRTAAIEKHQTFAFETVMSHSSRINELVKLKNQAYRVLLIFIATDDPEKNVARVTNRFKTKTTTGHFVAPDKVKERYHRTLALLPKAVEIADAAFIYDNSVDFEKASLQAVTDMDTFALDDQARSWTMKKLVAQLQSRERQQCEIDHEFAQAGQAALHDADVLNGQYTGRITKITEDYIVQLDNKSGHVIIHDRLMLDTSRETASDYSITDELRIIYSAENAPEIVKLDH
ncbi:zeta toxin family protein [Undibacterium sp. JH2W]|uniref:zeta toxin family protein n=1 Tax=Undibacterium sp. JH2W TaxID=3413037 RepID=UPI003BF1FB15